MTRPAGALADFARGIWNGVWDVVLPRACVLCEREVDRREDTLVCSSCLTSIRRLPSRTCERCGHPTTTVRACDTCAIIDPAITRARSWCWADDPVARACLHAFKYDGWHAIARTLARCMHQLGAEPEGSDTTFVPVPLAPARLRERGYNQALVLARALARLDVRSEVADVLVRVRETPSQTRLTRVDRFANVAGAFQVNATPFRRLGRRRWVLVDDVMTTGATLNACAAALRAAGVESLHCLTFGRARAPRDATPA